MYLTFTTQDYDNEFPYAPKGGSTEIVATLTPEQICAMGTESLFNMAYDAFNARYRNYGFVEFHDWGLYEEGECLEGWNDDCGYCEACKARLNAA